MRISTKLAFLGGFSAILVFGMVVGTARADETNQTQINFNFPQNILAMSIQPMVCQAAELSASPEPENEEKPVQEAKIETKKVLNNSQLPQGKFVINASAYTAAADECGKSDGITASGVKVKENETIACPKNFPFGTKLNIEGYGTYICQDRGGAIKGNKIDIYMETKAEAFAFGRRNLVAEVVLE